MADPEVTPSESDNFLNNLFNELFSSYFNIALLGIICVLLYKIFKAHTQKPPVVQEVKELPRLRRDFPVEELKNYDGTQPDGRILVAVNGKVFDVTRGRRFYGPGGPYSAFGGKDASRGLATFSATCTKDEYDDLSDLNSMEMDSIREWEMQFTEKYELVGKLLKPGEAPTHYSDEEEEGSPAGSRAAAAATAVPRADTGDAAAPEADKDKPKSE